MCIKRSLAEQIGFSQCHIGRYKWPLRKPRICWIIASKTLRSSHIKIFIHPHHKSRLAAGPKSPRSEFTEVPNHRGPNSPVRNHRGPKSLATSRCNAIKTALSSILPELTTSTTPCTPRQTTSEPVRSLRCRSFGKSVNRKKSQAISQACHNFTAWEFRTLCYHSNLNS